MKAAQITGFRKIEVTDIPDLGELKDGEVRFKTEYISICGSDIHGAFEKVMPEEDYPCLLYTSPSPRDRTRSRMPSSA